MVRSRNNRVVMSQRDIRQTNHSDPGPSSSSMTSSLHQQHHHHHLPSTIFCTWCRNDGRHFSCLCEWAQPPDFDSDSCYMVPSRDWTKSSMSSEGWVPASGPCCEDCLEAAFERRRQDRDEVPDGGGGGGGQSSGGYLLSQARSWCCDRGQHMCHSLQRGWLFLCGWVERAAKVRRAQWWGGGGGDGGGGDSGNSKEAGQWCDVQFEAEGFLEVKVVVSKHGVLQHWEVDFPLDVPVALLKVELTTVIHCPADQQRWFYKGLRMDERRTLEELNVDIGAILEVKCQN